MHLTTSKTKRKLFAPVLKTVTWLSPRCPKLIVWLRYVERMKKLPHLKNPKNLNEKILWLALNTDTSEWSRLADKYAVRDYVKECGLEDILVRLYGVYDKAEEIDFGVLPVSFVLKTTHGSADVIVVKDKTKINVEEARLKMQNKLDEHLITSGAELHYLRIPRKIVAEEFLINDEKSEQVSKTLIDYKIWCFNGKAHFIWVCMNRFVKNKDGAEVLLYDRDWKPCPNYCAITPDFSLADPIPKPDGFEHMLEVAEKLSEPFPVVRCDLYNLAGKIYFGEMTFTSYGGIMDFYSEEFLNKCGDLIDLNYPNI